MKLVANTIGISEVSYPLDQETAGATAYQAPNIKIQLKHDQDYSKIYELFADAGVTAEYTGGYQDYDIPQEPYYTSRHIVHFTKRENIVKAIEVLENLKLIPDTDEGRKLRAYGQAMLSEERFNTDVETQKIWDWQSSRCNLHVELPELKNRLLAKLNQAMTSLKTHLEVKDIQLRETYLQELRQLIDNHDDAALLKKIAQGKIQFNRSDADLAYVLLREGEDFIQQYHLNHHLIYRREVYRNMVIAAEKCQVNLNRFNSYVIDGDPIAAYHFLSKAAQSSADYLGSPEAQYQMGQLHRLKAAPLPADEKREHDELAVSLYQLAAERKHITALTKLGKMYMLGSQGIKANSVTAVKYLGLAIGDAAHFWGSESLEYILGLVDMEDKPATEFLKNKMTYHQQEFLKKQDLWLELIKANPAQFVNEAKDFRYGRGYVAAGDAYFNAGIVHLRQLHYLADSGSTDIKYRSGGYVMAKQLLVDTYEKMAEICQQHNVPNDFRNIAESYKARIAKQIEDQKPKSKTPQQLLVEAIEQDDPIKFEQQLTAFGKTIKNPDPLSLDSELPVDLEVHEEPLICLAAKAGSLNIVRFLIEQGANIKATSKTGGNALQKVCILFGLSQPRQDKRLAIAKLLIDLGVPVNASVGKNYTALHNAALSEFDKMVALLLANKADVDSWDLCGRTPLNLLMEQHKDAASPSTIEILLRNGASINAEDKIGVSPWQQACFSCPTLKPLLEKYQRPSGPEFNSKSAREIQKLEMYAASLGLFGNKTKAMAQAKQRFNSNQDERKAVPPKESTSKDTLLSALSVLASGGKSSALAASSQPEKKKDKKDDFGSGLAAGLRGAFSSAKR